MNQLDRKILETLGWEPNPREGFFKWFADGRSSYSAMWDGKITTDMLVEAACKAGRWQTQYDPDVDKDESFGVRFVKPPGNWYFRQTFPSALRAALAAHFGVSDE